MRIGYPISAYLDSNLIIRFVESEEQALLFLIENAAADLLRLFTSELTLAEVLVAPLKARDTEMISIYEEMLTTDEALEIVPIDRSIVRRSAEVRATIGNKGMDAIHVATAIECGCTVFISSDERIRLPDTLSRIRVDQVDDLDRWP